MSFYIVDSEGNKRHMTVPIHKGQIFNSALPAAEGNLFGTDLAPTIAPCIFRIYVCISVGGILRIARTRGGTTVTEDIQTLVANSANIFDILVDTTETINLRYSVTTGTIKKLTIHEVVVA